MKMNFEDNLTRLIDFVFKKNIKTNESEKAFWTRHWKERIKYVRRNKIPYELSDKWQLRIYNKMHKLFLNILDKIKNKKILEAGCGSGYSSIMLAKEGAKVYLLDNTKEALKYSKMISKFNKIKNVRFRKGNLFNIPYATSIFDITWNSGVIEHYKNKIIYKIIDEMKRVTKKDGLIMIAVPNLLTPEILYRMIKIGKGTERFFTKAKLRKIMEKTALKEIEIYSLDCVIPSFIPNWIIKKLEKFEFILAPLLGFMFVGIGKK